MSWDLGLRLFAAVHHHVLTGVAPKALSGDWADFTTALSEHHGSLARFVRERGVQTNETQRCVALLPAFLAVARATGLPLELVELGPSAGLNLVFDRYRYRYAQGTWGDPRSELSFTVDERGEVPAELLATPLEVRRRRGIDLDPVDVTTDDGVVLLHSFVWPGRADRVERLDSAIATFLSAPQRPELIRGDYVDVLPDLLAGRPADVVTVVFQTASTGYLGRARYEQLRSAIDAAGADGQPLAWVSSRRGDERESLDEDSYELELRIWPAPARLAAHVDFHGNWIDWRLPPKAA